MLDNGRLMTFGTLPISTTAAWSRRSGEEMSVSGEFQRYLASTLESVEEAERTLEGEEAASISALRTGLESARMGEETPLADRATLVLDALEHHLFCLLYTSDAADE